MNKRRDDDRFDALKPIEAEILESEYGGDAYSDLSDAEKDDVDEKTYEKAPKDSFASKESGKSSSRKKGGRAK